MKEVKENKGVNNQRYYFPVVFERNHQGYAVRVVGFDNILTSGETLEEAERNAKEAITAHINQIDPEELSLYTLPPEEVSVKVIEVSQEE